MTKTQVLDAFRNIGKQLVSFLSVIVIAMLAVLIYLGINYSATAMDRNVSSYYIERNAQDVQVISPILLTEEDLQAICALEGVADAEGSDQTNAWLRTADSNYELTVLSLPERISVPEIHEGRAPQSGQECMLEQKFALKAGLQVGDRIRLTGMTPDSAPLLMAETEFTVTGLFSHPDHVTDNVSYNYYVIVPKEAFDQSTLEGNWPRVRITLTDLPDNHFSKEYWKAALTVEELLKELSSERSPLRYEAVRDTYEKRLSDGEAQLQDAKAQLEDADRQLAEAEEQIRDVEAQLRDGEEQIAEGEKKLRDSETQLQEGEQQIQDGEIQLRDGEEQLRNAEEKLRDAEAQIANGERMLKDAEEAAAGSLEELEAGKAQLAEAERRLGLAPGQLADGERKLRDAEIQLSEGKDKLDAGKAALETAESYIYLGYDWMKENNFIPKLSTDEMMKKLGEVLHSDISSVPDEFPEDFLDWPEEKAIQWIKDNIGYTEKEEQYQRELKRYQDGLAEYEQGRNDYYYMGEQYLDGLTAYEKGKKEIEDAEAQLQKLDDARDLLERKRQELEDGRREVEAGRKELESKREELEAGKKELEAGREEIEAGRKELEEKRAELLDAKRRIEDARAELAEKKQEYEDGLQSYEDYRTRLDAAREELERLESGAWIVMDNHSDIGYVFCQENSGNLASLSNTFSLLFIVIAALVIYASVGRMVDEQSVLVGTTKALGLYNREVLLKYMVFGVLGTMTGVLLGILLAWALLQPLILHMYAPYYNTAEAQKCFLLLPTLVVVLGGLALSIVAVWIACRRLLKRTAIQLMKGEEPVRKRKEEKKNSSGGLYTRLIVLNMTSDLKRVIVTIVSIAGCCMLLLIAFMLKYGQDRIPGRQFDEILTFDAELRFDASAETTKEELSGILDEFGADYITVCQKDHLFIYGDKLSATRVVTVEPDSLPGYYNLRDARTREELSLTEHGVLIPLRVHEEFDMQPGTTVTLYDDTMQQYDAVVDGVFNLYCGRVFFLSPEGYREIFADRPVDNCFYIRLNGRELSDLTRAVSDTEGFLNITDATAKRAQLEKTAAALNVLIIVMIVIAGLMAFFILVNLSGSYMIHKQKELTIMRINGFTVKECTRYAGTELIITTIVGILLGILLGAPLGYWIQIMMEASDIQQVRGADIRSILFSALITAGFSLIINGMALRKVRTLKLSDI